MYLKWYKLVLPLSLIFVLINLEIVGGEDPVVFGLRVGLSPDEDRGFEQYEAFINHDLPWGWRWPWGWTFNMRLNATTGVIRGRGNTGLIGSFGPGITSGDRISLDIGVSPAFLSEDQFRRHSLGGEFYFISHIGTTFRLIRSLGVNYRFQHMSNAGINRPNPGLNLHMFGLSYRFRIVSPQVCR